MAEIAPIKTLQKAVEETLTPMIDSYEQELSPTYKMIFRDSGGVTRDNWGRNWILKKVFKTGLAGAYKYEAMDSGLTTMNTSTSSNDPNFNIYGTSAQTYWQGPDETTQPGYFNYDCGLIKGVGNLHVPAELMRVDQMDASLTDQLGAIIEGTARRVSLHNVVTFLSEAPSISGSVNTKKVPGIIATISSDEFAAVGSTIANGAVESGLSLSGGSIRRFEEAQEIDLYYIDTDDLILANDGVSAGVAASGLYVNVADPLAGTIDIINRTGGTVTIPASGTTVYVVQHGTYGDDITLSTDTPMEDVKLPYSLEMLQASSGEILGSSGSNTLDTDRHPWAKSYIQTHTGALSETALLQYLSRVEYAKGNQLKFDLAVTTPGVFVGYVENGVEGFYTYERNDAPLKLNQGYTQMDDTDIVMNAFGRKLRIRCDSFVGKGKLYGLVTANRNWKKHVPPRLRNAGSRGGTFDAGIEFMAPVLHPGNGGSIFAPVYGTTSSYYGQLASMLQAPFWYPYQILPDKLPSLQINGITESMGPVNS